MELGCLLHGLGAQFRAEQPGVGDKAITLKNCRNVTLRDFSVLKGGHFAVLATGVDNLILDNLLVDTDRDGSISTVPACASVELHGEFALGRCNLSQRKR
jgi:polygalacturonase